MTKKTNQINSKSVMQNIDREKKTEPIKETQTKTQEDKFKLCNRCKTAIGIKDTKCPNCLAPTSWQR